MSVSKPEVQVGHKLSVAQAELQACEAHLAAKEQELNAFRTQTVRVGLEARCKAMVECGWKWGEMGKEGMRALETLDAPMANGHGKSPRFHSLFGCIGGRFAFYAEGHFLLFVKSFKYSGVVLWLTPHCRKPSDAPIPPQTPPRVRKRI